MEQFDLSEMVLQRCSQCPWQHSHPVPCTFPIAHRNLIVGKVEVVYPQTQAFHQAQTGTVEQTCHEIGHAVELREHGFDFVRGKDGRHALRAFGSLDLTEFRERLLQYMAVEKEESV